MLVHEPPGVGRTQELTHLDGPRLVILLALPTEPRAREPPGGRRKCTCRDRAVKSTQRRMYLCWREPELQHVRDVLRPSARGARYSAMQAGEGPILVLTRRRW